MTFSTRIPRRDTKHLRMGKNKNWLVLVCLLWAWNCAIGQSILREKVISTAESQLYVREKTGNNDGKEVERYLRNVGLGKGYAWCAAFVAWCHDQNGIPNAQSAYSPDWFKSNVVYERMKLESMGFTSKPRRCLGCISKLRAGWLTLESSPAKHGLVTKQLKETPTGMEVAEGDGVYRKIRNKRSIYIISDYCMSKDEKSKYLGK